MTRVAVCVCTCRRPGPLDRLLASLAAQRFEGDPPEVELVLVDNDPEATGRPVARRWAERLAWPVRYAVEPRPGIPRARNRALDELPEGTDVVAFVDDDEWAAAGWLDRLLEGLERHGADVATGPQMPLYPEGVPEWLARAGFFRGNRHRTGREVPIAYTHNVAFRAEILGELEHGFHTDLAGVGGSDTEFFHRVRSLGKRIVWVDEAVVFEPVTEERAGARWLLRRHYRYGTTAGLLQRRPATGLAEAAVRAARELGRAALSPLRLAALPYEGRGAWLRFALDWSYAGGFLAGWAGFAFPEYRRRRPRETDGAGDSHPRARSGDR